MKEAEYNKLKAKIVAEYQEKLRALDMVWRLAGGSGEVTAASPKSDDGRSRLVSLVRQSALSHDGQFTSKDIGQAVSALQPDMKFGRASISKTLKRLEQDGVIRMIKEGTGRLPSIYRRSDG